MERAEFRTYYKQFIERFAAFVEKRTHVPFIVRTINDDMCTITTTILTTENIYCFYLAETGDYIICKRVPVSDVQVRSDFYSARHDSDQHIKHIYRKQLAHR